MQDYMLDDYYDAKVKLERARSKAVLMENTPLIKRIERDLGYIVSTFVKIKEDKEGASC